MQRLLPALLACAIFSGCAKVLPQPPPNPPGEASAAFAPVAVAAIRSHRRGDPTIACIRAAITDSAFDRTRTMEQVGYGPNGEELKTRRRPEDLARGEFNWRQFSPAAEPASGPPLDPGTSRLLDDAATAVIREGAPVRRLNRVEPDLAAGIPFCWNDGQRPALSFSAPAIHGDIAFVETSYDCGALCGAGYIYALRRGTDGRWAIIGELVISFS